MDGTPPRDLAEITVDVTGGTWNADDVILFGTDMLYRASARGGVRAMFSGHEHNFQHSSHEGIDYFVTGAGSKVRTGAPDDLAGAHTVSWADEAHFLLVTIAGDTMTVRAIGELADGEVRDLPRVTADGERVAGPMVVQR